MYPSPSSDRDYRHEVKIDEHLIMIRFFYIHFSPLKFERYIRFRCLATDGVRINVAADLINKRRLVVAEIRQNG